MWKSPLLAAIAGALLTGVITVSPALYNFFVRNRVALTYQIIKSDLVESGTETQILIVRFRNAGRIAVKNTFFKVSLPEGTIDKLSTTYPVGMEVASSRVENSVTIEAPFLNPGEEVRLSVLASGNLSQTEPDVSMRAENVPSDSISEVSSEFSEGEVRGILNRIAETPFLAFGAIALYSLIGIFFYGFIRCRTSALGPKYTEDRDVVINLISNKFGLSEYLKANLLGNISYITFADTVIAGIINGKIDPEIGKNCLIALLELPSIARSSREQIESGLKDLLGSELLPAKPDQGAKVWLEIRRSILARDDSKVEMASTPGKAKQ